MDAKLEEIVEQFCARVDELVPVACREKSLAKTNIEQAQDWAERGRRVAHPASVFHRYEGAVPGWTGWIEWGGMTEAFVAENGEIVPTSRIIFEGSEPVEFRDADGVRRAHPGGPVSPIQY